MPSRYRSLITWVVFVAVTLSACGGPDPAHENFAGTVTAVDFAVGTNRVPFLITNIDGERLEHAQVHVRFFAVDNERSDLRAEADALFYEVREVIPHEHPDGLVHGHADTRGFYVVPAVELDLPGVWVAEFTVMSEPAVQISGQAAFVVRDEPTALGIGDLAPASKHPTLAEVSSFDQISSRNVETDRLHDLSIADALARPEPFVVVFASPFFCISQACGPVVDVAEQVQASFSGEANFIHVEPWDLSLAREQGRLVPAPIMNEWRLPSEPWTFVIDADGRVVGRFESLVAVHEIEQALLIAQWAK